jgi:probable rRNA maturation factor
MIGSIGPSDATLQAVLTDDSILREHNLLYRGLDRPTDVLSFSYLEQHETHRQELLRGDSAAAAYCSDPLPEDGGVLVGQILISIETLLRRGASHAATLEQELSFLLVHGALHVLGFDHQSDREAAEMERFESEIMDLWCGKWR